MHLKSAELSETLKAFTALDGNLVERAAEVVGVIKGQLAVADAKDGEEVLMVAEGWVSDLSHEMVASFNCTDLGGAGLAYKGDARDEDQDSPPPQRSRPEGTRRCLDEHGQVPVPCRLTACLGDNWRQSGSG